MGRQLTLAASLPGPAAAALPEGYAMRPARRTDLAALGELYFTAYEPGTACATVDEAVEDVAASFDGEYGPFWPGASPIVVHAGEPAAAIMTVRRAPWDDVPDAPFVIELFTRRDHRRRGLARALVCRSMVVCAAAGEVEIALRVDSDNAAALGLYESLGFSRVARG